MVPVPAQAPSNTGLDLKAFQNLGYTGEWFVFVAFVLFMWWRLYRRELETLRDAEAGLLPAASPAGTPGAPGTASAKADTDTYTHDADSDAAPVKAASAGTASATTSAGE